MNLTTSLRRLGLLAAVSALALSAAPAAHAQSTSTVQIKRMDTGLASSALNDGTVGFAADNNNDFRQRFTKELVSQPNLFRLSRAGFFNACIRVPDGLGPNDAASVKLGSCSGPGALWRESSFNGGKLYRNPSSGHYLVPGICFDLCAEKMDVAPRATIDVFGGLNIARWTLDVL